MRWILSFPSLQLPNRAWCLESIIRKSLPCRSLVSWGAALLGGRGPRRAAPGGLNPVLRRLGTGAASLSENSVGNGTRRAVNQQQRGARPRSWLGIPGGSSGTGVRVQHSHGACRAGRMVQDGRGRAGSLAGRGGRAEGGFSVLWPLLVWVISPPSQWHVWIHSVPPLVSQSRQSHLCFFQTSILSLDIVTLSSFIDFNAIY